MLQRPRGGGSDNADPKTVAADYDGYERRKPLFTLAECSFYKVLLIGAGRASLPDLSLAAAEPALILVLPSPGSQPMPTKIDYQRMLSKLQVRHVNLLKDAARLAKGHDRVAKEREATKCATDIAKLEKTIAQIR